MMRFMMVMYTQLRAFYGFGVTVSCDVDTLLIWENNAQFLISVDQLQVRVEVKKSTGAQICFSPFTINPISNVSL